MMRKNSIWSLLNSTHAGRLRSPRSNRSVSVTRPILVIGLFLWRAAMAASIDVDEIFAQDRENRPLERTLPWEESRDGMTVVVEP